MTNDIDVSIVIVTYNSSATIEASILSLINSNIKLNWELLVVDNNSSDNTLAIIQKIHPPTKIIKSKENLGFAAGCNLAVSNAGGEYIIFYNPDLEIDSGAVDALVGEFTKLDKAGAATGRMRFPDSSFQSTARKFPDSKNIFFSRGSMLSSLIRSEKEYTLPDYAHTTEVDAVSGTFMIVKKNQFEQQGGFDTRFFMYLEDTDLSYRLLKNGLKNYYIPGAGGVHLWGKGSKAGNMRRNYYHHRSMWRYFRKHHFGLFSLFILPILLGFNLFLKILKPENH